MALVFPTSDVSRNKPRVRFVSQSWTIGRPDLKNTKGANYSPGDAEVQLYLPGNFEEGYGANWGDEDVFTALVDPSAEGIKSSFVDGLQKLGANVQGTTNAARYDLGRTSLPGKFLVFESADSINLNFNFELIPRNHAEAATINDIVATFKRKILPTFTGAMLTFPDVWSVQILGLKGPGFPDCAAGVYEGMALRAAVPSYIGNTSTLAYSDEYPVGVILRLQFQTIKHPYLYKG